MKPFYKTILLLFLSSAFIIYNSFSQSPLARQWDKRFGGSGGDLLFSLQQATDRGYILGGWSASGISGDKTQPLWDTSSISPGVDYWIVKTDSLGQKEWDKDFGGTDIDLLFSLQQTVDGGFIFGGPSASGIGGDKTQPVWDTCLACYKYDYWIVKTGSLGNKQWDKRFGGMAADELVSLQQTTDGGYILGGISWSGISGDKTQDTWGINDYWIVKIDSLGTKQWDKDFGGTSNDALYSVKQTSDGGYILAGVSYSGISGDKTQDTWGYGDFWIVKTDSLGNKQWDKDYGGTDIEDHPSIMQTADGGYIITGQSMSAVSGDKTQPNWDTLCTPHCKIDYWIIKADSLGNKQWDKDFGGIKNEGGYNNNLYEPESIIQTPDGGYLFSGTSASPISGNKTENNLGQRQTWLVKTDSLGIFQWDKTIFVYGFTQGGIVINTNDGCYVVADFPTGGIGGYKTQNSRGNNDYWMVKFCDSTLTTSIPQLPQLPNYPITISPNPSSGIFQITFPSSTQKTNYTLEVVNTLGQTVYTSPPAPLQKRGESSAQLDLSFLPKGIYLLKISGSLNTGSRILIIN